MSLAYGRRRSTGRKPETTKSNDPEVNQMQARVGKAAPNFEAPAFLNGDFTTIKLTDYLGKWVLICFYPGDRIVFHI